MPTQTPELSRPSSAPAGAAGGKLAAAEPAAVVANPGRLRILAALAGCERGTVEFVALRRETCLTDGNLASHARRLQLAGLIDVDKRFRAGKPVTNFALTPAGRDALAAHARALEEQARHLLRVLGSGAAEPAAARTGDDGISGHTGRGVEPPAAPFADSASEEEDWVD